MTISTETTIPEPPYEIAIMDPLTGRSKMIVDLGDTSPTCGLQNDNTFVYGTLDSLEAFFFLTTVDLSTGETQEGKHYPDVWFTNIGFFDQNNKASKTFVIGASLIITADRFKTLYELLPDQTLREIAMIPSELNGIGTYSPSKQMFFLVSLEKGEEPFVSSVLAVSTAKDSEGKVLFNVSAPLYISTLVHDDTLGVLYAWGFDFSRNALLVSLDFTSGKILRTFFQSTALFAGPACAVNKEGSSLYASLKDLRSSRAVIVTVDLNGGNATQVFSDRFVRMMSFES